MNTQITKFEGAQEIWKQSGNIARKEADILSGAKEIAKNAGADLIRAGYFHSALPLIFTWSALQLRVR